MEKERRGERRVSDGEERKEMGGKGREEGEEERGVGWTRHRPTKIVSWGEDGSRRQEDPRYKTEEYRRVHTSVMKPMYE